MDITPMTPDGKQVIVSYGPDRFKVNTTRYRGSIVVLPDMVHEWNITSIADLTVESLEMVFNAEPSVEILLLGCGSSMELVPSHFKQALRDRGVGIDQMDTGAACRTYNILLSEGRRVAAALIAMPAD